MTKESAEQRQKRLEIVAGLTARLHVLEDFLAHEPDPQQRESYEAEKSEVMRQLREVRRT